MNTYHILITKKKTSMYTKPIHQRQGFKMQTLSGHLLCNITFGRHFKLMLLSANWSGKGLKQITGHFQPIYKKQYSDYLQPNFWDTSNGREQMKKKKRNSSLSSIFRSSLNNTSDIFFQNFITVGTKSLSNVLTRELLIKRPNCSTIYISLVNHF